MKEGICTEVRNTVGRRRAGSPGSPIRGGCAQKSRCGATRCAGYRPMRCGGCAQWSEPAVGWGRVPVQPFAEFFARVLEAPVVDQTGIPDTALFNFVLEFDPDGLRRESGPMKEFFDLIAAGGGDMQIASDPSTVPRAPDLVTAVEEQLGLRLERVRAPREFIVIDQVERPAPN